MSMSILLFIAVHVFSCMSVMVVHGSVVLLSSRHLVLHSVRFFLLMLHGCAHRVHLKLIILTFFCFLKNQCFRTILVKHYIMEDEEKKA